MHEHESRGSIARGFVNQVDGRLGRAMGGVSARMAQLASGGRDQHHLSAGALLDHLPATGFRGQPAPVEEASLARARSNERDISSEG